jgi:hypothetical protein
LQSHPISWCSIYAFCFQTDELFAFARIQFEVCRAFVGHLHQHQDSNGFEDFHVYVCCVACCAAFLCQFRSQLQGIEFNELCQFMQQVPMEDWEETEIEIHLSQANVLSTFFWRQ